MNPHRKNDGAAEARIAELEAEIAEMRERAKHGSRFKWPMPCKMGLALDIIATLILLSVSPLISLSLDHGLYAMLWRALLVGVVIICIGGALGIALLNDVTEAKKEHNRAQRGWANTLRYPE